MACWSYRLGSGVIVCGLLCSAEVRAAAPVHIDLAWTDEAHCAAPVGLDEQVSHLVGDAALDSNLPRFDMRVSAQPNGLELVAHGRAGQSETHRTFALSSCSEAQEAAVLLIAMTLAPASFVASSSTASSDVTPEEPTHFGWAVHVAGTMSFLTLPALSGGPLLGLQFAFAAWRLGLDGRYFVPREKTGLGSPVRADVGLTAFALSTSWRGSLGRLSLGPQAELEAGFLRGQTTGVIGGGVKRTLWLGALLGVVAEYSISSRVSLQVTGAAGVPLWRPRFALEGERPFYTAGPAILRLLFGIYVWIDTKD